ncbi:hypothetical protein [uncultured Methanobrevibacter sp.]|uniref:hypothetical protein n=1 Tax=uncultured Methanobrevibacter sp. TaxID=253161 RepID=UPI0025F25B44|nr:hypothetical protein [uncultured Methanobrevibacter sp.]
MVIGQLKNPITMASTVSSTKKEADKKDRTQSKNHGNMEVKIHRKMEKLLNQTHMLGKIILKILEGITFSTFYI